MIYVTFAAGGRIERQAGILFSDDAITLPAVLDPACAVRVNGSVVDARRLTVFFIDDAGQKHPARASDAWQELACSWADELIRHGGVWSKKVSPTGRVAALANYAAAVRYASENGGLLVNMGGEQVRISTARGDDRNALSDTFLAISADLRGDDAIFKFADGPRAASNADMAAAIKAAFAFVQSRFDIEADVLAKIESGEIATETQIEAAFS